jgi:hypothetical protein
MEMLPIISLVLWTTGLCTLGLLAMAVRDVLLQRGRQVDNVSDGPVPETRLVVERAEVDDSAQDQTSVIAAPAATRPELAGALAPLMKAA